MLIEGLPDTPREFPFCFFRKPHGSPKSHGCCTKLSGRSSLTVPPCIRIFFRRFSCGQCDMALPFYHSRRLHSRRSSVYVYLVAFKAIQEFFSQPYTPPVTLGLIGLMTVLHLRPGTLDYTLPSISQVCLNPALVVEVSVPPGRERMTL